MERVLVATACDAAHFALVEELLASLQMIAGRSFRIGFVQLGNVPAPASLIDQADEVRIVSPEEDAPRPGEGFLVAQLAIKARLPEFFPGHDLYIWLDGDTWVQNPTAIDHIINGAHRADLCVHPQLDPHYLTCRYPDDYTLSVYDRLFGPKIRDDYARFPMVNAGVFGALADSPLWARWAALLGDIRRRLRGTENRFFSDQIPLHYLIFSGALSVHPLRAVDNWLVPHGMPQIDPAGRLVTPTPPHEEIHIVHLLGSAKWQDYRLGGVEVSLRFGEARRLARAGAVLSSARRMPIPS